MLSTANLFYRCGFFLHVGLQGRQALLGKAIGFGVGRHLLTLMRGDILCHGFIGNFGGKLGVARHGRDLDDLGMADRFGLDMAGESLNRIEQRLTGASRWRRQPVGG